MPSIYNGVTDGTEKLFQKINNIVPFANLNVDTIFQQGEDSDIKGPLKIVGQGLLSTSTLLGSTGLVMIYTFLFLYYKESFKTFIIYAFEKENRPEIKETLNEIKETIQSYIGGLGLVVVILSVLNTIGLYLIGIEHAIFWGTLAGFLAIIPYIGTLIGGLLPFIYALSTAEASWQPYAVLLYYLIIQQVEGNFITPKIVGDKVDINPLFAIFALVFFGSFWGVGGIILALPLISITKIIFSYFGKTKALSVLMSSDISSKKVISEKNQNKKT
jgi:predicted PurR-regulated permease PerM